ncbi:MAG: HD domain-containing protein [Lachnospiraceae bacterium]|jgi:uncharacterized protein|nr:HD domain-containing protein [Lachnospiraceae bacterium]MEE3462259.1 HD domain-containing protein [Lachnospiraceae bacterium]
MTDRIAKLFMNMIHYDKPDTMRIQHLIKVHDLSALIGREEGMNEDELFVLESAAILHDIGIHRSEEKYGSSSGKYQEIEGPQEAEKVLLETGGYTNAQKDRIKFLIAHHHTYTGVEEASDYRILLEADALVNIFEDKLTPEAARHMKEIVFRTKTGLKLLNDMYDI